MNDDMRQKIMLFVAVFLTVMMVLSFKAQRDYAHQQRERWYQEKKQREEELARGPAEAPQPTPTQSTPAQPTPAQPTPPQPTPEPATPPATPPKPATTPEVAEAPDVVEVTLVRGEKKKQIRTVFTSHGAALKRFRLLGYYVTPEHKEGEELLLLDELTKSKHSLAIEAVGDQEVRQRNYALISAPQDALVSGNTQRIARNDENRLVFQTVINNWEITKTYQFTDKATFGFLLKIRARNLATEARSFAYRLVGPSGIVPDDAGRWSQLEAEAAMLTKPGTPETEVKRATAPRPSKTRFLVMTKSEEQYQAELEAAAKIKTEVIGANICWLGLKNRFFTTVLLMDDPELPLKAEMRNCRIELDYAKTHPLLRSLFQVHVFTNETVFTTVKTSRTVQPGATLEDGYRFYGGPADEKELAFDPRLDNLITYTWNIFNWISRYLVTLLNFIAGLIGNYGVAMIIVTLLVKSLMHPLTRKGLRSSHKMQKVAPLVKEIQRKYKENREKMHQEVMRLYREHGVSPMGGCLPMLIQLPIFFSLYGAFMRGFALRHAAFVPGWVDDLAQPDRIYTFTNPLPVTGWTHLSVLPIIYVIMQMIHMSMQPKSEDSQIQQQQKMMKMMPILFFFIFYTMPAGLVLYFTVSNAYTLIEHWLIKRKMDAGAEENGPPTPGAVAPAPGASAAKTAAAGTGINTPQANQARGGKRKKKRKK